MTQDTTTTTESDKTKEEVEEEMKSGSKEESVYEEEGAEKLEEEDEIDELEEGFMQGYDEDINLSECSLCHATLKDEDFIEQEINGKIYRFCSEQHAEEFKKKLKNQ